MRSISVESVASDKGRRGSFRPRHVSVRRDICQSVVWFRNFGPAQSGIGSRFFESNDMYRQLLSSLHVQNNPPLECDRSLARILPAFMVSPASHTLHFEGCWLLAAGCTLPRGRHVMPPSMQYAGSQYWFIPIRVAEAAPVTSHKPELVYF